jgi:hypothetical protein
LLPHESIFSHPVTTFPVLVMRKTSILFEITIPAANLSRRRNNIAFPINCCVVNFVGHAQEIFKPNRMNVANLINSNVDNTPSRFV